MRDLLQDFAFGLRLLRRNPWLSAAAVLLLALGIGANTAIFSVLDAVLLKPLPYRQPERLVELEVVDRSEVEPVFSEEKYLAWRAGARSFSALAAYDALEPGHSFVLRVEGHPELVAGTRVSQEFFAILGVPAALGRVFQADEDRPGGRPVVVLSHRLWRRAFAGDPGVLGRRYDLDGTPYTIVGVMPPGFRLPASAELWTPLRLDAASHQHAQDLLAMGRLRPGVSAAQAQAEMAAVNRHYLVSQGWGDSRERPRLAPLSDFLRGAYRQPLTLALSAVAVVLLIACANIANLQLARFAARQREIAIRASLGASGIRILRQLLAESTVLALLGGGLGLALCGLLMPPLLALAPPELAGGPAGPAVLDARVFGFALLVSLLTGFLAGIAPALEASRARLQQSVAEGTSGAGGAGGRRGRKMRHSLVVMETALALLLLISAGLLIRSFAGLRTTDPGFRADHLLTLKMWLPPGPYGQPGALERLQRELLPEIAAMPGVRGATLATSAPLELGAEMTFVIPGRYVPGGKEGQGIAQYRGVSAEYFQALGIKLRGGRWLLPGDGARAPGVVLLNETAAHRFFPGQNPLGQRLDIGLPDMPEQADPAPREVVGVVADVRDVELASQPAPILYVPLAQVPPSLATLLVQRLPINLLVDTAGAPGNLAHAVRDRIWAHQPDLAITGIVPMAAIVDRSLAAPEFQMLLLSWLALLALLLAALGIYGVIAYLVAQRTREIGIRMALGGHRGDIQRLMVRQGMAPALLGIGIGLVAALAASRLLRGLVTGVSPTDLATFTGVPLLMAGIALLATWLPARRASRVNPTEALRYE
ncbi:MAG TPA: ABC transporter permease [Thermoanaerobaculia bacterium]|jgi:putative ABC transport system permease protein|nr:ABC transporter permease [Thermoanaerobaculia bacterium]